MKREKQQDTWVLLQVHVPAGFSTAYTLKHRKAIRETPTQERLSVVIIPTYKFL